MGEGLGRGVSLTSRASRRTGWEAGSQGRICLQFSSNPRHLENKLGPGRCRVHFDLSRK